MIRIFCRGYAESKSYHGDAGRFRDDKLYYESGYNNRDQDRPTNRPDGGAASRKMEMEGPLPTRKEDSANSPRGASSRSFDSDIRIPDAQQTTVSRREANSPRSGSGGTPPRRRTSPFAYKMADRISDRDRDVSSQRHIVGDRNGGPYGDDSEIYLRGSYDFQYDKRGMMAPPRYSVSKHGDYRPDFPPGEYHPGNSPRNYYDGGEDFNERRTGYSIDDSRFVMENENIRRFSGYNSNFAQNGEMQYGNLEPMTMMSRVHDTTPPFGPFNIDATRAGFNGHDGVIMSPRGMTTSPRRYY